MQKFAQPSIPRNNTHKHAGSLVYLQIITKLAIIRLKYVKIKVLIF